MPAAVPKPKIVPRYCALLAGGIGAVGLAGWILDIPALQRIHPDLVAMKANTAIALMLAGLSLLLLQDEKVTRMKRRAGQLLAVLITVFGVLTMGEYLFGWDLRIDQFFFRESLAAAGQSFPGRMGIAATVVFICLGTGLLVLDVRLRGTYWATKLALVAGVTTTLVFLYYFFGIQQGEAVPKYAPIALHTVLAFYALCGGIFFARPGRGFMLEVLGPSVGSEVARRILPAAFFLPLLLGWMIILGERVGLFGLGFGAAAFVVLIILAFTGLIRTTVIAINRQEAERYRAEFALRRSEAALRDFVENAPVGLHWVGHDGTIIWANQTQLDILGYTREEYIGQRVSGFHADSPVIEDILTRLTKGETLNEHPARLRRKDGSIRHVLINSNVFFEDDRFVHTRCFTRDITERREAEAAQARLAAIVMSSNDAIISKSLDGTITTWNPGAERIFGYAAEEMIGQSILRLIPPDLHDEEKDILARLTGGEPINRYETERVRKDGSRLLVSLTIAPIYNAAGNIIGASKIGRDITQRKQAEEALRASENLKSSILDSALDAIITMDHEGKVVSFNPAAEQIFGLRCADVVGQALAEMIIPERLRERHYQGLAHYLASGEGPVLSRRIEVPALHANGREFQIELSINRIVGTEPPLFTATLRDITERQQAQDALRESEERFRVMADNISPLAWMADPDGSIFFYNQRWYDYTGKTPEEMQGWGWEKVHHPDHLSRMLLPWKAALESGQPWEDTFPLRGKDGDYRWFLSRAFPIRDTDGKIVRWFGTNIDIDDHRRAMEELASALQAKDDFLAALSHELRTPLTPVLMMATALGDDPALPPEVREQLGMMRRNIELEARLIDDLLDLTRITHGKLAIMPVVTDVHEVLKHTAEIVLSDRLGKEVSLVFKHEAVRHHTMADPARLQQVFWNLIKNAIKFSPSGQTITVRTHSDADGRIFVTVADKGLGISAEALPNIFKAFEQGDIAGQHRYGGLGLGLAISKAIMEAHGSTISVESDGLGLGATFTIALESVDAPSGTVRDTGAGTSTVSGKLRILIVEDHETTRTVLAQLLTRRGHQVTPAGNVREALAAYGTDVFDVVISDLGLPDGSGMDLMREIQRIRPVPAIALSGYGMEDDVRATREAGFTAHLVKPVNIDQLRQLVEQLAQDPNRTPKPDQSPS